MPKYLFIIIGFLLVFSGVLRFFMLDSVPNGLEQDETSLGYNAYSIYKTGKDEHGRPFPLYFKAFGEYKLPGYIYSTIPFIAAFGLNEFSVRFPAALAGVMTVVLMYVFVRQLFPNRHSLAILSSLCMSIAPWHLHFSRGAFEVSLALFFILSGAVLYIKATQKNSLLLLFVSFIPFLLSMYTYNIARLFTPVLILLLLLLFPNKNFYKGSLRKVMFVTGLILFILPFTFTLFSFGGVSSVTGTLITSSAVTQAELLEMRGYLVYLPSVFTKLFFNQWFLTIWKYLSNIFSYFSVDFFFLNGSKHGNHGIGNVGQFYVFMLPLLFLGILKITQIQKKPMLLIVGWLAAVIMIASFTREAPHATRGFFLLVPLCILIAIGAEFVYTNVKHLSSLFIRRGVTIFIVLFALYNIVFYLTSYYVRFPTLYAPSWRAKDAELTSYINQNIQKYDKVYIDSSAGLVYISLLYFGQYSPEEFQKTSRRKADDSEGFSTVQSFGKYIFTDINWEKINTKEKALYVTTAFNAPKNMPLLKTMYYPVRPVVSAVGQEIISYPVEDVAYVVTETN